VVKRAGIGPADVHAGAAPDRLEPFQDFDRGSVITVGRSGGTGSEKIGHLSNAIGGRRASCQAAGAPSAPLLPETLPGVRNHLGEARVVADRGEVGVGQCVANMIGPEVRQTSLDEV